MNNPGIDTALWEGMKKKWTGLQAAGHKLQIEFRLIADPKDEKNILAIDVVQNIDNNILTETVQHKAGEAYEAMGIAGLSMERLTQIYNEMIKKLYGQVQAQGGDLTVSMSPSSPTSGQVSGYVTKSDSDQTLPVQVNYRHYYVLTALHEKLRETTGDNPSTVRAVYRPEALEFYFEY